jgi:type I restriction enzyme S subunit
MINNNLPNNWKAVDFGDIFNFEKKSKHKASEGKKKGKYMFFTSSNSQSKSADFFDFDGEYLIFGTGGNASIHCPNGRFSTSGDCLVAKIKNTKVLTKYVYRYLTANMYLLKSGFKGAGLKHISKTYIQNIKIPYPENVEVQKKIAAILEKTERLKEWRKEADKMTDEFLKSTFLEMFGDPVNNSNGWEINKLQNLAEIVSGVTKGRKLSGKSLISAPYLRVANVQDGYLDLNEIKTIEVLPTDIEKYALLEGDVLLTEGGDPDKLGRGAVWYNEIKNCIHQNHIFRVRVNKAYLIPEFLSILIGCSYGKIFLLKSAKQTTGIASINSMQLKNFPVILPPLDLQNKFANIVLQVEHLQEQQGQSKQHINDLFNALMQKAFKGELAC